MINADAYNTAFPIKPDQCVGSSKPIKAAEETRRRKTAISENNNEKAKHLFTNIRAEKSLLTALECFNLFIKNLANTFSKSIFARFNFYELFCCFFRNYFTSFICNSFTSIFRSFSTSFSTNFT